MIGELVLAMEAVAPRRLAASWDNTGLLLGDPSRPLRRALLTIDLTHQVLLEAIKLRCEAIVAYHPPIFEPLKQITAMDRHQELLLICAEKHIAILSPHTALDAVQGGMTDWFAGLIDSGKCVVLEPVELKQDTVNALPSGQQMQGHGRALCMTQKKTTDAIAKGLQKSLGLSRGDIQVSCCKTKQSHSLVAVVPGSGASLLRQAIHAGCTLMVTGEAKHHDVLRAQENGCDMILAGHTNTERGFLPHFAALLQPHVPTVRLLVSHSDHHPLKSL